MGLLLALAGCGAAPPWVDDAACDPRTLAAGEVRARRVPCGEELIAGGEGRTGDWLLENAVARFLVRGGYGALTELEEEGGTLIDAATPGGVDLLAELRVDGDRGTFDVVNGDGWAEIVLPGVTWHLDADSDSLVVTSAGTGRLLGLPGVTRTGATLSDGESFLGVDGTARDADGATLLDGITRVALTPRGLYPGGRPAEGVVDADAVRVEVGGAPLLRLPVAAGGFSGWAPADAQLVGERDGCVYDGLAPSACARLHVRVADDAGDDVRAWVGDASGGWTLPKGGGIAPVGPEARSLWVWAGPAYTAAKVWFSGADGSVDVSLHRELDTTGWVLADLAEKVAPDASTSLTAAGAAAVAASQGVGFVAAVADDEVPWVSGLDEHDDVLVVAASRAAGWLWSWPWSPSSRKPGHGAVRWGGLGALDQLTWSEGGAAVGRLLVVTAEWVDAALSEASPSSWDPRPDAFWLDGPEDVETWLRLLDLGVDATPVGDRTWVRIVGAKNVPAVEAGIVEGRTSAGTGPRVTLAATRAEDPGVVEIAVTVDAPRWAGMRAVTLWTSAGAQTASGRTPTFRVPSDTTWVVAEATGEQALPWGGGEAWAVSAPLWIGSP